jgi:hypothetical protein
MNKNIRRHIFWIVISGVICFFTACNNDSVSEKQAESFLKYYAVSTDDNTGTKVIQTSDGYAIMGNFESGSGQKDIFIIFTDKFGRQKGNTILIGTERDDLGYSMIELSDGYIIAGTTFNTTQKWGYLVNISSDGRVLWERKYSGYQELVFRDAYRATDGTLIITGHSIDRTGDDMEAIIFKAETNGDSLFCRTFGRSDRNDVGEAIIEHEQRYHVITTSTPVSDNRLSRIRMINTNTRGGGETSNEIEEDSHSGKDLTVNTAGNMYILGNIYDYASRDSKIFLAELELKSFGQITDLKYSASIAYDESLHAESFAPVEQNELAIGGWQVNPNDKDILFLKVDSEFGPVMLKTYGSEGNGDQESQSIIYTGADRGYALTGSADLAGGRTTMLLKIDSEGELK